MSDEAAIVVRIVHESRWIPVSERLPDIGQRVMVIDAPYPSDQPLIAMRFKDADDGQTIPINSVRKDKEWVWKFDGSKMLILITHWMELPPPPEPTHD